MRLIARISFDRTEGRSRGKKSTEMINDKRRLCLVESPETDRRAYQRQSKRKTKMTESDETQSEVGNYPIKFFGANEKGKAAISALYSFYR